MTIPLYTGQAAKAARLAIKWRRCATQTVILWRVSADMAEAAATYWLLTPGRRTCMEWLSENSTSLYCRNNVSLACVPD